MSRNRKAGTPTQPGTSNSLWQWQSGDEIVAAHMHSSAQHSYGCAGCPNPIIKGEIHFRYAVHRGDHVRVLREHVSCKSPTPDRSKGVLLLVLAPAAS